jgi:hypothetical protein
MVTEARSSTDNQLQLIIQQSESMHYPCYIQSLKYVVIGHATGY